MRGNEIGGDVDPSEFSSFRALLLRTELHAKKVRDVMGCSNIDPVVTLQPDSSITAALCILGAAATSTTPGKRAHRVLVVDPAAGNKVTRVVSQSAVLEYLEQVGCCLCEANGARAFHFELCSTEPRAHCGHSGSARGPLLRLAHAHAHFGIRRRSDLENPRAHAQASHQWAARGR